MGDALRIRIGSPFPALLAPALGSTQPVYSNTTADADGEGVAMAYRLDCTGTTDTITHVGYRKGTVTGTPAANSYDAFIQGIGADGLADGTDIGGGSPTLAQFTPDTSSNIWQWVALTNSVVVNRDQIICPTIKANSNLTASNNIQIAHSWRNDRTSVPYSLANTTGAFVRNAAVAPCMAVKSASAVYGFPQLAAITSAYGNTAEVGMWFNIPTNFCSTFKVVAIEFSGSTPASGTSTHYATIYSNPLTGTTTIKQQSSAWDVDQVAVSSSTVRHFILTFDTAYTLPALNAGEDYVIALATTTASAGGLMGMTVESAGDWDAWTGGQQFGYTSRTLTSYPPDSGETGNFAAVTATQRPFIDLILSDLTAPAGGSGGGLRLAGHGGLAA